MSVYMQSRATVLSTLALFLRPDNNGGEPVATDTPAPATPWTVRAVHVCRRTQRGRKGGI
jgi:hypothetical protein